MILMPELLTNHFGRWNSLLHQDEHVHYITSFQCITVYPGFPLLQEPKSSKTETWIGEIKSFNPINGYLASK